MICGRGHCLDVAHRYGFKRIITARQIARLLPTAVPFASAETGARQRGQEVLPAAPSALPGWALLARRPAH